MRLINHKVLMIAFLVGIALFNGPAMATDVGGIIDTDTTWDLAGSPYNITSDIQIPEGVTLSIDPGVILNSGRIEVWGTLQIIGLEHHKITLNAISIEGQENDIFLIQIQHAVINGGSPCLAGSIGNGSVILKDSRVSNTQQIRRGNKILERNIFIDTEIIWVSDGDQIMNNVFYNSLSDYVLASYGCSDVSTIIVRHNSFLGKGAIRVWGSGDMTATNNFWNTTDTSVIDSMIIDRNDDLEADNFVEYEPFLEAPHPDTPILNLNQSPIADCGNDKVVFDEVTLDGSASYDPDGTINSYEWSLNHEDGSKISAFGSNPTISKLPSGFYDVTLTVTDDGGLVHTDNMLLAAAGSCFCTPSKMNIESITAGIIKGKYGKVTVSVFDDCGSPLPGAEVKGTFSGDFDEIGTGVTDANGVAVIMTTAAVSKPSYTFCVVNVVKGSLTYEPNDNVETCESM